MIQIHIPGVKELKLKYLVLDFNGTIGVDGRIIPEVTDRLNELSRNLEIFIVSADTYGDVREQVSHLNAELRIISGQNQDYTKMQFVRQLGSESVVAIGNGRSDAMMLQEAALGIAVIEQEGCSVAAINNADMVVKSFRDAIGLLLNPARIVASMRM